MSNHPTFETFEKLTSLTDLSFLFFFHSSLYFLFCRRLWSTPSVSTPLLVLKTPKECNRESLSVVAPTNSVLRRWTSACYYSDQLYAPTALAYRCSDAIFVPWSQREEKEREREGKRIYEWWKEESKNESEANLWVMEERERDGFFRMREFILVISSELDVNRGSFNIF